MLSRKLRLPRKDFLQVKYHGTTIPGRYFSAIVFKRPSQGNLPDRLAVVVSRKTAKKATVRNHLRRFIYNIFAQKPTSLSRDIVIFCRVSVINLSDEKIHSQINSFLSKIPS